ncbi:SDR family NAD(P)-dependent oxidoreductase [Sphingosinicella xenopeptidilytica]|uniref:SDR family NAD(P)-dependent oxidoreductase n=1 Tax=Sphingosinicella xenopeptidilytica TaxID=364098 RepID=A0ABW3C5U5_SPHXN
MVELMDLQGKTAIVTGGGTGIGEAVSLKLAARGANVIINYRSSAMEAEEAAERCQRLGVKAVAAKGDVGEDRDCRALAHIAQELGGSIDMLVNNAGTTKFAAHSDLDALSADDFLSIYRTNLVGAYQMIRAVTPAMKAAGRGSVVNIASIAGLFGGGSSTAYSSSKGALINLTKTMARALAPTIRVNVVCPGFIATRWYENRLPPAEYQALLRRMIDVLPLRHSGTAEEVADGVIFLLAEGANLVTGETLIMDSGAHLELAMSRAGAAASVVKHPLE